MKSTVIVILTLIGLTGCLNSKDEGDGAKPDSQSESQAKLKASTKDIDAIIFQEGLAIGMQTPQGWQIDKSTSDRIGLCAVFVVKGSNFDNSPAVIYSRLVKDKSVGTLVHEQVAKYKKLSPDFKMESAPPFQSKRGMSFEVMSYLNGPSPNNFETVGYLKHKKALFLAVYTAKDQENFEKHKPAFLEFLEGAAPYNMELSSIEGHCVYPQK